MTKDDYIKLLKAENQIVNNLNSNLKEQVEFRDKNIEKLETEFRISQNNLRMATEKIEYLENENNLGKATVKELLKIIDTERLRKFVNSYKEPKIDVKA